MARILPAALLLLAAACVPAAPGGEPAPDGPLVSSLSVRTGEGDVRFLLQITNASERPVTATFSSGQSYDFTVRQQGRELWRWSAGTGFTQALREVTIAPGETLEFEERWTAPAGATGELEAEAAFTSSSHPLRQGAVFRLP